MYIYLYSVSNGLTNKAPVWLSLIMEARKKLGVEQSKIHNISFWKGKKVLFTKNNKIKTRFKII